MLQRFTEHKKCPNTLSDKAMGKTQICKWFLQFKRGKRLLSCGPKAFLLT
jgi:hypothetical protein